MKHTFKLFGTFFLIFLCLHGAASAQTNEFTYQGRISDTGGTAAGYDFTFRLFSAENAINALGTRERLNVPVNNGIFSVRLNFPAANFDGSARWLEIAVKPAGSSGGYTTLMPRQPVTSSPYSIKSLNAENADNAANAAQLGGVAANQYVRTTDSRLSDARNPLSGSGNYIQNNSGLGGQSASFNITGNGLIQGNALIGGDLTVNGVLNAATQFNLGSSRVLSIAGTGNTFTGRQAGTANTGADNSFFGFNAGNNNTSGADNSFFGSDAGGANTTGFFNTFVGSDTGDANTTGNNNSFFGRNAGGANTTGSVNSFIGNNAGDLNTTGSNNTVIGASADVGAGNLTFATAIGAGALVSSSNTVVLGRAADTVRVPGTARVGFLEITGGSDLAENFEIAGGENGAAAVETVKPGMLVAIDPRSAGKLTIARGAYNRRVAGIISGANNLSAGMLLPDLPAAKNSMPLALSGRVWVFADAAKNPIIPGDLLTTSETPGHAMKATNYKKAQGAIVGKAMTELKSGKGLVLVLVTLQ